MDGVDDKQRGTKQTPERATAGKAAKQPAKEKATEQQAQEYYNLIFDDELRTLLDKAEGGDDEAREELEEMHYGIMKYATYHQDETTEWHVTLAGGGPAARLVVVASADGYGEVEEARFEYQNWFTPWTPAPEQDSELVARFVRLVGHYEQ